MQINGTLHGNARTYLNLMSRPVFDADNNPVLCQEAVAKREALIQKLGALPPVQSALDQIVHRFGHDAVAEITGRSRRVLRIEDARGERLALRSRPASANLAETAAFMDRTKRILVFSMAGGIGRSYHADLGCPKHGAPYPLPAGARLAGRPGDPGPGPDSPHSPGLRAALPSRRHRREGRAAVHRHHRAEAGLARRDHAGPAGFADRHGGRRHGALQGPATTWRGLYAKSALRQFYIALWRGTRVGAAQDMIACGVELPAILQAGALGRTPPW